MLHRVARKRTPPSIRLAVEGTRVVVLNGEGSRRTGVISDVRVEPYLRPYAVTCDDGHVMFASAYELAREDDRTAAPLGPLPPPD